MKIMKKEGRKPIVIITMSIILVVAFITISSMYIYGKMSSASEPEVTQQVASEPLYIEFNGESYPVVAGVISNDITDTVWVESTAKPGSSNEGTVVIMTKEEPEGDIVVTTESGDFHYVVTSRHPKVSPGSTEWRVVGNKSFNRSYGEENLVVMTPHRESYTIVVAEPDDCCDAVGECCEE